MTLTRESKCPLCGSGMTDYHESHSDGESTRHSIRFNDCRNNKCGLPVRLWEQVGELQALLYECLEELDGSNPANGQIELYERIRQTLKGVPWLIVLTNWTQMKRCSN